MCLSLIHKKKDFLRIGFIDFGIEKGNPNTTPTHKNNRIDYALISENSWAQYKYDIDIEIDDEPRKEFTDHSAIILKKNKKK